MSVKQSEPNRILCYIDIQGISYFWRELISRWLSVTLNSAFPSLRYATHVVYTTVTFSAPPWRTQSAASLTGFYWKSNSASVKKNLRQPYSPKPSFYVIAVITNSAVLSLCIYLSLVSLSLRRCQLEGRCFEPRWSRRVWIYIKRVES